MKRLVVGLVGATIGVSGLGGNVFAGIAISIDSDGYVNNKGYTQGWEFTPIVDILVDSLGVFDHGTQGLNASHLVKLWTLGGSELAFVNVSAGVHDPLDAGNVFVPITPVLLSQGQTYVVSSYISGDYEFFRDLRDAPVATLTAAPELSVADNVRRTLLGNGFPTNSSNTGPVPLGANFTFSSVPEPSTLAALLGIGLTGLLGVAWRRRRAAG